MFAPNKRSESWRSDFMGGVIFSVRPFAATGRRRQATMGRHTARMPWEASHTELRNYGKRSTCNMQ